MTSGKKNDDAATPDPRRRLFLQGSIAGALLAAIPGCTEHAEEGDTGIDLEAASQAPTVTTQVVRAIDMLVLTLHFVNFQRKGAKLVPVDPALPMLLVVELPPQHVFEEAFPETGTTKPSDPMPVKHRLSGKSRLSFVVPPGTKFLDFDLQKVLSRIEGLDLALAKNATDGLSIAKPIPPGILGAISGAVGGLLGPSAGAVAAVGAPADGVASLDAAAAAAKASAGGPAVSLPSEIVLPPSLIVPGKPVKPAALETAIELPFRLQISPGPKGAFAHDTAPVARGRMGRYELWHTRLGVRMKDRSIDETDLTSASRTFRALWNRDRNAGIEPQAGFGFAAASLDALDRGNIVTESADFTRKPRRVLARRLMLSSLGGYLDALGTFDNASTGLLTWEHRAAMGRDNYVRTVYDGYLYPFGHRTVLVTVTERKFKPSNPRRAYLWQRQFLLVQEPVRAYGAPNDSIPGHAPLRQNPFRAIEIRTLQTPDLDTTGVSKTAAFCPLVDGLPFLFGMKAVDAAGNIVDLHAPVLWVPRVGMPDKSSLPDLYKAKAGDARNAELRGQRVAFAPPAQSAAGADESGSSFETHTMSFQAVVGGAVAGPWAPALEQAEIAVPALRALSGAGTAKFAYAKPYLDSAFGVANQGEVLLGRVDGEDLRATFSQASDKVGGFVAPDLDVTALSRKIGPVSGTVDSIASIAKGDFHPEEFFAGLADARLFGMFPLTDVIDKADLGGAPRFLADTANTALAFVRDAKALWDQAQSLATDLAAKAAAASGDAKTRLAALQTRVTAVVSAVAPFKDLAALDPLTAAANLGKLETALAGLDVEVRATPELPEATRRLVASAFGKVHGLLAAGGSALTDLASLLALAQQGKELAENLTVKVAWTAPLRKRPDTANPIFIPTKDKPLRLSGELRAKATKGRPAGLDLTCALEDFKLDLVSSPSFILLDFEHILFKIESGKKPEIDVKLRELTFTGPLSFVNALKDVLPLDGFSDPPALDVSTQGIKASYSFPLPSVAVGIFSLANVSIGAALNVPFVGTEPLTVSFFFSTREHPFTLTVSALGGGGFFGITLSPSGVVSLEASIEFGASLALSFGGGAISGEVTVMAGIYFKIVEGAVTLTGYLRIRGEVDVLGLISASIDLRMELSYESGTGKVIGRATLEIEVEVLFFSTTVSTSVERKFAGSNGDPTFRDVYGATYTPCLGQAQNIPMPCASAWDAYVGAFADLPRSSSPSPPVFEQANCHEHAHPLDGPSQRHHGRQAPPLLALRFAAPRDRVARDARELAPVAQGQEPGGARRLRERQRVGGRDDGEREARVPSGDARPRRRSLRHGAAGDDLRARLLGPRPHGAQRAQLRRRDGEGGARRRLRGGCRAGNPGVSLAVGGALVLPVPAPRGARAGGLRAGRRRAGERQAARRPREDERHAAPRVRELARLGARDEAHRGRVLARVLLLSPQPAARLRQVRARGARPAHARVSRDRLRAGRQPHAAPPARARQRLDRRGADRGRPDARGHDPRGGRHAAQGGHRCARVDQRLR